MTAPTHLTGIELTHDPPFEARVRRLSVVSLLALGVVTGLAIRDDAHLSIVVVLTLGWILMPTLLRASQRRPMLRYTLTIPATLVAIGLTIFCLTGLPSRTLAVAGWWTITAAIWFGATLGMWLWFRWMPVPQALDDPFSTARLALIALHVGGVLTGIALILA